MEGGSFVTGKTHASCGCLIGMYFAKDYGVSLESVVILSVAVTGSVVPDICHTKSYIGRRLPIVSFIFSIIFGHRSFTHSLLFLLLNFMILDIISVPTVFIVSYTVGILSHLILDMMTKTGVSLFYPLKKRMSLPIYFKTGGIVDYLLFFVFIGMSYYILM